jgi:para-aminobenzoate synthetase component I
VLPLPFSSPADLDQPICDQALTTPGEVIRRWPVGVPLAAARLSGSPGAPAASDPDRWLFARPRATLRVEIGPAGELVGYWLDPITGQPLPEAFRLEDASPMSLLERALGAFSGSGSGKGAGSGGWVGWLSYDLGSVLELAVEVRPIPGQPPLIELHRYEDAWVLDAATGELEAIGDPPKLEDLVTTVKALEPLAFCSLTGREHYEQIVARALEYIHAGDIYEVNLAHTLRARFSGCPRLLASALFDHADPARGGYIEPAPGSEVRGVVSVSPELFVKFDAKTRTLTTRPMKGTRTVKIGAEQELRDSGKEQAELHMITDLMRNDLGRVCALGSVRVDDERLIETHAGGSLLQASARVSGRLRDGLSFSQALGEIFPAGSITGAPKIRAMQIIHELEQSPRGVWCGSLAHIKDNGDAHLSVAIRTAIVRTDTVEYPIGAGIVADSLPAAEWAETLAKASVLRAIGEIEECDESAE